METTCLLSQLFSKVSCRILQFLYQMLNVSVLLPDDALLKCVVTEVLFSIVAFRTLTFHKDKVCRYTTLSQGCVATH